MLLLSKYCNFGYDHTVHIDIWNNFVLGLCLVTVFQLWYCYFHNFLSFFNFLSFSIIFSVFPQLSQFFVIFLSFSTNFSVFPQISQFFNNFLSFSTTFSVFPQLSTWWPFGDLDIIDDVYHNLSHLIHWMSSIYLLKFLSISRYNIHLRCSHHLFFISSSSVRHQFVVSSSSVHH